jgi:hypothetical protein
MKNFFSEECFLNSEEISYDKIDFKFFFDFETLFIFEVSIFVNSISNN